MKFTTAFTAALLACAKLIAADSEKFGFLVIRSGSSLQYASAYAEDSKLYLGSSSSSLSAVITDDGKLKLSDGTYAVVGSDGAVTEGSESEASDKFSVSDGYLVYDGKNGFVAVPSGSSYLLTTESTDSSSIGVAIRPTAENSGSAIPDFSPSGSGSSSSASQTTLESSSAAATSQAANTTTAAPTRSATTLSAISQITDGQVQAASAANTTSSHHHTSTVDAISQISDGQIQASTASVETQSENGAPQAFVGLGAGVAAAAAAMLI